jgi:replicative DNA helicase
VVRLSEDRAAYSAGAEVICDIEAEQAFLGSMLLEREALRKGAGLVHREEFFRDVHRIIFDALCAMDAKGIPVDSVTLGGELRDRKVFEQIGGDSYLIGLERAVPHALHIEFYADRIRASAKRRRLVALGEELTREAAREDQDPDELAGRILAGINDTRLRQKTKQASLEDLIYAGVDGQKGILEDLEERRAAYKEKGEVGNGLPTGMRTIDLLLGGLQSGIHVLAAEPGAGKTTLALQWCIHSLTTTGNPCLFVTFDEALPRLGLKAVCGYGRLDMKRHFEGLEEIDPISQAAESCREIRQKMAFIQGHTRLAPRTVGSIGAEIMEQFGADKVLIVVDYLQAWAEGIEDKRDFRHIVDSVVRGLRDEALVLKSPILLISSQARGNQDKGGWTAKESSGIEYTADTFMNLISDKDRMVMNGGRARRLTLEKNRYGDTSKEGILLDFYPARGYMIEASK